MNEDAGSVWPEQEVIDKWFKDHGIKVSYEDSMALKQGVTAIRLEIQRKLEDLEMERATDPDSENPWRKVENELPVIPEDKYGVSVIVAYIDPYNSQDIDEYCTTQLTYSRERDGVEPPKFRDLATNGKDIEWLPFWFHVTHWRYGLTHPMDRV